MGNPTIASARNAVRHRIRDGLPVLDATPVPFNTVRLEELTDQIAAQATPTQTIFQTRFVGVPTQQYMNVQVIPQTLVAYVDGSWVPTLPTKDVDFNGNFTLPVPPLNRLLITYAWQYLSDGEVDQFVDESRQWLREFSSVNAIPDGLAPALFSYASARAIRALASTAARLARVKAGDSEVDWSALAKDYQAQAKDLEAMAVSEREAWYTQGPEAKDPTAFDISHAHIDPYTPLR